MSEATETSREIGNILEPSIDEARIAATWQRIKLADGTLGATPPRRSRALAMSLGFAGLATAALAIVLLWPASPGPLALTDHGSVTAGAVLSAPTVALDDGSIVELSPNTQLEVLDNDADRFVTLLRHGRAHFDVKPNGPRRWEIESSRATVEVVGTAFTVSADDRKLVVAVERGVVVVRGERVPGRVVRLTANQQLVIDDSELATTTPAPPPPTEPASPPLAPAQVHPTTPPPPNSGSLSPSSHASSSSSSSSSPPPPPPPSLAAALSLADTQRAHGDPASAASTISRALAASPRDESAGLAYFTLGRIYLDDLHQPTRAAAAFERVIALGTPRSLLEDAYARLATALHATDRRDDATRALAAYDAAYPHGVRRAELHQLFGTAP